MRWASGPFSPTCAKSKNEGNSPPHEPGIVRDQLTTLALTGQADKFLISSLQLYREEIERSLRSYGEVGFQLLDLHDYAGQGSAATEAPARRRQSEVDKILLFGELHGDCRMLGVPVGLRQRVALLKSVEHDLEIGRRGEPGCIVRMLAFSFKPSSATGFPWQARMRTSRAGSPGLSVPSGASTWPCPQGMMPPCRAEPLFSFNSTHHIPGKCQVPVVSRGGSERAARSDAPRDTTGT